MDSLREPLVRRQGSQVSMRQGIEGKIRAGGPNLDMGYWESLLQQLRAHMARAR